MRTGHISALAWRLRAAVAAALIGAFLAAPASAQTITTNAAVARLFEEPIQPEWFAPALLAQAPVEQIAAIVQLFTGQFGPLVAVEGTGGELATRLARATIPTLVALDAEGRITGLRFGNPVPVAGNIDETIAQFAGLPGQVSVLVLTNGEVAAGHVPEASLGVGSSFKLAVLATLVDAIEAGRIAWDDVVPLDPAWRSLPTGVLQDWPEGTPVTVAVLANLMISISDNTATDALVLLLGRDAVEAAAPANAPFLTTGELFRLKSGGNEALAEAYIAGDEAARRAILDGLAGTPLPPVEGLRPDPVLEIEWFFNAFELCALLERVADAAAMRINPGLADPADWARVAFKGGSEAGVLNLSTLVTAADGTTHCVVATWNDDAPLPEEQLFVLYAGLLGALAAE